MIFRQLLDPETSTWTYLLADPVTRRAVLIDPVLGQVQRDLALMEDLGLTLAFTLETHVHADHVTAAAALREATGSRIAVPKAGGATGADRTLRDGEVFTMDGIALEARATPGHTDGCTTYVELAHGRAFTGDALLIRGCGRTDFQQGDAGRLYDSVHGRILSLPPDTLLYPGHDYQGRTVTTVDEERRRNPRLTKTRAAFVAFMGSLNLPPPKQLAVAVPANLRVGATEE